MGWKEYNINNELFNVTTKRLIALLLILCFTRDSLHISNSKYRIIMVTMDWTVNISQREHKRWIHYNLPSSKQPIIGRPCDKSAWRRTSFLGIKLVASHSLMTSSSLKNRKEPRCGGGRGGAPGGDNLLRILFTYNQQLLVEKAIGNQHT